MSEWLLSVPPWSRREQLTDCALGIAWMLACALGVLLACAAIGMVTGLACYETLVALGAAH